MIATPNTMTTWSRRSVRIGTGAVIDLGKRYPAPPHRVFFASPVTLTRPLATQSELPWPNLPPFAMLN